MKERLARFMQGRYGMDALNQALTVVLFVVLLLNVFLKSSIINLLLLLLLFYLYFRMFSRNISKRYAENVWYVQKTAPIKGFFRRQKNHTRMRKDFHLYKCPNCKQTVRVPKGKGKIAITCPKCRHEFVKRS